jgi:hypothetical protein
MGMRGLLYLMPPSRDQAFRGSEAETHCKIASSLRYSMVVCDRGYIAA